jgi:predicted phosphoadenosine phosphosulfate sulfurtransferase
MGGRAMTKDGNMIDAADDLDTVTQPINNGRRYLNTDVYTEARKRIAWTFDNFERIYLSFSGGKDSGVLLNLIFQHMEDTGETRKLGIQILDNEANYELSLEFMHRMMRTHADKLDIYWCCLPISLPCSVSSYQLDWQCWGEADKERWVRPMPTDPYIVNIHNHPFQDFFHENMLYSEFWDGFGEWYSQGKSCANLIGIRASESLHRYRAIMHNHQTIIDGRKWTKRNTKHNYHVYPIYDWKTDDIWTANARFDWDYNKLYDIFWKAGMAVGSMRVASPFMSEAKSSLGMYRVIDPPTWAKLCARVQGANFIATYGKQLNYRSFTLPAGYTWKSFTRFLLDTLPKEVRENFESRFIQSIRYWARVGRGLPEVVIAELDRIGHPYKIGGITPWGNGALRQVRIAKVPDHFDEIRVHPSMVISWKRFAITILKNDHVCKYLGLAPTQEQQRRQKQIQAKYRSLG